MGYEDMDARQLQQACRDRGLPTARDKATMLARLTGADPAPAPSSGAVAPVVEQPSATPGVWQERYPAGPVLGDAEHQKNCAAVVAAAQDAGRTVQGSGRRAGTVGGEHVYEVFVR